MNVISEGGQLSQTSPAVLIANINGKITHSHTHPPTHRLTEKSHAN